MERAPIIEMTTGVQPSRPFYLGDGIAHLLADHIRPHEFDDIFLVTGEGVRSLVGEKLAGELFDADIPVTMLTVAEGEQNKSWSQLTDLCERLVHAGATKNSIVLALGGGMVSNLTGLAAGLLYRGVRYVDIPTTMLSLTDGTLSNKQAINGAYGKNQFGLYSAPLFVWADVAYLRSEPARQWKSGLVEALKNGLIDDASWFERLGDLLTPDLALIRENLLAVCHDIIASKHRILASDPSERDRAIILEYGHTVGHAVEFLSAGIPHGEAVGIGMCAAARVGHQLGITSADVLERQQWVLGERLGNPTTIPAACAPDRIFEVIRTDNKRRSSEETQLILLDRVGTVHNATGTYETPVPESVLKAVLQDS